MDRFELCECLYTNFLSSCSVFRAIEISSQREVCIKRISISSLEELPELEREALTLSRLCHQSVCELYYCFFHEEEGGERHFCLVMELLASDLEREAEKRRRKYLFWTEEELWTMLREAVSVLAYLQENEISHRDIKPQNIFLSSDGHIKLGDFGSSKDVNLDYSMTLQGTPIYLSPKLRTVYTKMLRDPTVRSTRHNPYKSDVFSLGMSFLHMALLEPPLEMATLKGFNSKRNQCLARINMYSKELKAVLRLMLEKEESKRPDFLELARIVDNRRSTIVESVEEVRCMGCPHLVNTGDFASVSLPCQPEKHCFCSKDCFCTYIQSHNDCPLCHVTISSETTARIIRLREEEETEMNESVCAECKRKRQLTEITQCAHHFCWDCVQYWKENYKKKQLGCPKCGRPLKTSAIRWMQRGCTIL